MKNIPKNDFFDNIDNKIYHDLDTSNETANNFDSKKIKKNFPIFNFDLSCDFSIKYLENLKNSWNFYKNNPISN